MKLKKTSFIVFKYALAPLVLISILMNMTFFHVSATQYTDVTKSAHGDYYNAIYWVTDNGFMNGTSATTFEPNSIVNRAMLITVLYRHAGSPTVSGTTPFTDVPAGSYYYDAVRWGYANGITDGVTATTFEPGSTVTREQAFTIFYRYSYNYCGYTPYYYGSITNATDYSSLSTYARNPMRWAVSNGILVLSQTTPTLYPKAGVYRKELALWLCRFSANVEGITSNERYSFVNDTPYFLSGLHNRKLISVEHVQMLYNIANSEEQQFIDDHMTEWSGSCFGMSLTCALDQLGYLDFNNSFANANNMFSIPSLRTYSSELHELTTDHQLRINMSEAESAINFYQLSQIMINLDYENYGGVCISNSAGIIISGLDTFVEKTRRSGLALFTFYFNYSGGFAGHTVLVFGSPKLNGSKYEYTVYDPNVAGFSTLSVDTDYRNYSLSSAQGITTRDIIYITNFNVISSNNCDLDGSYNTASTVTGNQIMSDKDEETKNMTDNIQITEDVIDNEDSVWLNIVLRDSNYTITNAEGEKLTIADGLVGGTMPILQRTFFGEASVTLRFKVPFSESFTFTCDNSDADNYYHVSWGEQFASADGTGMESVTITQSDVQLTGDNMEYQVRYSFAPEASYKAFLSGSNETFVMFEQSEDGFRASTQNDAQLEIKNLETQTVVFSESVAANSIYSLNYQITDNDVVLFENP